MHGHIRRAIQKAVHANSALSSPEKLAEMTKSHTRELVKFKNGGASGLAVNLCIKLHCALTDPYI